MPRKQVLINPNDRYHISARCVNREWFYLPMPAVWSIMEDYLFLMSHSFGVQIHAFVLMSNHFHLILTAPLGNLSQAMRYFMRETSREINRLSGRINQTYGARHHKSRITCEHDFMVVYKYVYRNPVRAGVCSRVQEYPYSTLNGLCGLSRLNIPLTEDTLLFSPTFSEEILSWLNAEPSAQAEDEARKALKRPAFALRSESSETPLNFDFTPL